MDRFRHEFKKAKPEEQGSFCNEAGEHVNNLSDFSAEQAYRTAIDSGAEVVEWEGSDSPDTRHNHQILDADEYFEPAKYRPGK
ncbi:MAG: hypothetical protein F6J97_13085 [Leptolyngbya sp. SIO4C1]|nr:hypothetical protein [Leptolyngbya sp. SIO4C1]